MVDVELDLLVIDRGGIAELVGDRCIVEYDHIVERLDAVHVEANALPWCAASTADTLPCQKKRALVIVALEARHDSVGHG